MVFEYSSGDFETLVTVESSTGVRKLCQQMETLPTVENAGYGWKMLPVAEDPANG